LQQVAFFSAEAGAIMKSYLVVLRAGMTQGKGLRQISDKLKTEAFWGAAEESSFF